MLNNLENAASLNNLLLHEGFSQRSKKEDGTSYFDEPNSTSFIETTNATLVKVICIYDGYSCSSAISTLEGEKNGGYKNYQ